MIEVTLALAILSTVIASTFLVANGVTSNGRSANERGDAVALEQQQAEILRNLRDNAIVTAGTNGWANFTGTVFGGSTPVCGSGSIPVKLTLPAGVGHNTWTWDNVTSTYKIATASNTYTVSTVACYTDSVAHNAATFTVTATWDDGKGTNTSNLSTTLASIADINQQDPAF